MDWRERFADFFWERGQWDKRPLGIKEYESFIESEIIEKIIADIPEGELIDKARFPVNVQQQLRTKWLSKNIK